MFSIAKNRSAHSQIGRQEKSFAATNAEAPRRAVCNGCFELAWRPSSVAAHTALMPIVERPLPSTGIDLEAQHFRCKECGSRWSWTMADGWKSSNARMQ